MSRAPVRFIPGRRKTGVRFPRQHHTTVTAGELPPVPVGTSERSLCTKVGSGVQIGRRGVWLARAARVAPNKSGFSPDCRATTR